MTYKEKLIDPENWFHYETFLVYKCAIQHLTDDEILGCRNSGDLKIITQHMISKEIERSTTIAEQLADVLLNQCDWDDLFKKSICIIINKH